MPVFDAQLNQAVIVNRSFGPLFFIRDIILKPLRIGNACTASAGDVGVFGKSERLIIEDLIKGGL